MLSKSERALTWFLRLTAFTLFPAAFAVVMPHAWMNAVHQWLGLHDLPDLPIVEYLTRSLSALYAMLGAICWFLSRDVRTYRALLRFTVPLTLLFAATLGAIDVFAGMPWYWTVVETAFLIGWTCGLWWLVNKQT